jgi:hypothetical protein
MLVTSIAGAASGSDARPTPRQPLRLVLSASPGRSPVDGAWWPQTHDIDLELPDLVDHLPADLGGVYRALYSRPDWTGRPRRVATAQRKIRTGAFLQDDLHLILLSMWTRRAVRLLVVPPEHPSATRAMRTAADPLNRLSGAQILFTSAEPEAEEFPITDQWNDTGGNWWQGSRAPSFRGGPRAPAAPIEGDARAGEDSP